VVAAARRERILLSGRSGGIELEDGTRVVIEAANEVRVVAVLDPGRVEQTADRIPRLRARTAEVIGDARCIGLEGLTLRDLAIEQAQRIGLQTSLAIAVQLVLERTVVLAQELQVRRPADVVADRVELQPQIADSGLSQPPRRDLDDLRIERRARGPDGLDVVLEELAVPALPRPDVAEHRPEPVKTRGLRPLVEPPLEVSAHDTGGGLGTQGQLAAATILEAVKLLGDGVCVLADSLDELGTFDDRGDDLLVREPCRNLGSCAFGGAPQRAIARKNVANAADRLDRLGARHGVRW